MAIRNINEGISAWNKSMPFPKDRYIGRILEEKFAPNNGGNPMVTREWEIVAPEVVTVGDKQISVVGAKITQYSVVKVLNDEGKSEKAFGRFRDDLIAMGYKGDKIDDENPPLEFKGKCFHIIVYGKEQPQTKTLTAEERATGERVGKPILDPETGKPIIGYQLAIDQILGVAPA
jgi:hypothetical protein